MRFNKAFFVAIVAGLVLSLMPTVGASAATATPRIRALVLRSQTPWVGKGGTFQIRLGSPPPQTASPADLEFAIAVHPASGTRSAFTQTLTNRPTTSPLAVITTAVTEAVTDESGAVTLDVGIQDPALPRDRTRVGLRGAGVYPVAVDLRSVGGPVHARLLTHLIFVPETPTGPKLAVGMVVPIRAPLALRPDGTDRLTAADVTAITAVATTLATLPTAGVLVAPSPETLAALSRGSREIDTAAFLAVRSLGAERSVLVAPFVATQTPESTAGDRTESLTRGNTILTNVFGNPPDSNLSVIDDPNDDRLEADPPTARVIVADKLLQPAAQRVTNAEPVLIRRANNRTTTPALISDSGLAAHLDNDAPPVLAAHHLLADIATIYFDSPGRFRSVVVNPPPTWRANASVLGPLLAGLESSPIVAAAPVDRLFEPATPNTTPRTRVLLNPPTPPPSPAAFATTRRSIASMQSMMVDGPAVAQSFTDRLLIAESAAFDSAGRRSYVEGLAKAIEAERGKFRLPTGGSLTLTSRRGGIPVTVQSKASYPAHVLLQVASDRLRFPGGSTKLITLSHENTTQRFTVQSLGSGAFPLRILLKSPDGRVVLSDSRLTIRSTNASGVGIALSVGALLFLIIWWIRHHHKRRGSHLEPVG